jgi:hypothetical protein
MKMTRMVRELALQRVLQPTPTARLLLLLTPLQHQQTASCVNPRKLRKLSKHNVFLRSPHIPA